ncbi:MAG: hypothetical protein KH172_08785, partial [Streptococcus salivarius]|nr:hypothetical protein [Streptococcus salivarius]
KKQPYIYYVRLTFKNRHFFRYLTCLLDRGHIITGGFDFIILANHLSLKTIDEKEMKFSYFFFFIGKNGDKMVN